MQRRDQFDQQVAMPDEPGWRSRIAWTLAFLLVGAFIPAATSRADTAETAFLHANTLAMDRMMDGMTARPSGSVDTDFVNMMEPHHQGAIDMAQLELLYGTNEQLRRIAQEIIVDQQQEIIAMRLALGRKLPPLAAAPDQRNSQSTNAMKNMLMPNHQQE
jgi:hypothetical protein